jgi:hypothetical protein
MALLRLRACACLVWRSREVQISVRFSLRFAGRSWGLLLGVPNWPEAGRGSVVAIIVGMVVVFVYSYTPYLQVPAVFLKLPHFPKVARNNAVAASRP